MTEGLGTSVAVNAGAILPDGELQLQWRWLNEVTSRGPNYVLAVVPLVRNYGAITVTTPTGT